ncbi:MAG: lytic transglycosylase domain-containing protein, partial [Novosphingobium sp.]|nr:lytic transglycosylase domain-containing protein [Novosphingobium sp.]
MKRATATALIAIVWAALLSSTPALANSAAVDYFRNRADRSAVPSVMNSEDRAYYRQVFQAIERKDWARVRELFEQRKDGLLHQLARAEYFLAPDSPRIDLPELQAWLAQGTELPRAEQIVRLAVKRGAQTVPSLPAAQQFQRLPTLSRRTRPASVNDGTMPAGIASNILEKIRNDDPKGARQLLDGIDAGLSDAARAEWRGRIAWSFYIEN